MSASTLALAVAALLISALLTALIRRLAVARGVLDIPNERSLHSKVTPRGGGLAIVVTACAAIVMLATRGAVSAPLCMALVGGGIAVAWVGFVDDHRSLSAAVRLTVHVAAALWALAWLGGLPALRLGTHLVSLGWGGYLLGALGIVWALNLFNFMDGIDGLAASEATFIAWSGAMLASASAVGNGAAAAAVVFGASCLGFLRWNWPPASIFMGDVGSGFAGYVTAVLALGAARQNPVGLWTWLILGGVFFVDATVTLLRRLLRGERVYEAHRSHSYQSLARRWGSHGRVTLTVLGANLLWLLPSAALAQRYPQYAAMLVVVALAPLTLFATVLGSGRREHRPEGH
jgi:Fuc2NAc and GlcNAc transferase